MSELSESNEILLLSPPLDIVGKAAHLRGDLGGGTHCIPPLLSPSHPRAQIPNHCLTVPCTHVSFSELALGVPDHARWDL